MTTTRIGVVVIAAALLGAAPADAQDCTLRPDNAVVHEHAEYRGRCRALVLGNYTTPAAIGLPNDSISSIRVGSDARAVLCVDANYGDHCELFTAADANLGDNSIGNDTVSSMRVLRRGGVECAPSADQVSFYAHSNFLAPCSIRGIGEYANADAIGLPNDSVSSIRVGANVSATVCHDDNFERCERLGPGAHNTLRIGNDELSSATVYRTPRFALERSIFVGRSSGSAVIAGDADRDGLRDADENAVAEAFKPLSIFDAEEQHRRPVEPIILYQVRPGGCAGAGCGTAAIHLRWSFLFLDDGGYTEESWCPPDSHRGDNDIATFVVESTDGGQTWVLTHVAVGSGGGHQSINGTIRWPAGETEGMRGGWLRLARNPPEIGWRHPIIYHSRGKHHLYLHPGDVDDAPYSDWWCHDDNTADGAQVWADLRHAGLRFGIPSNVGEPEVSPSAGFLNNLTHLFDERCGAGRAVWSTEAFCGGAARNGDIWLRTALTFRP